MNPHTNVQIWKSDTDPGLETSLTLNTVHAFPQHFHEGLYSIGIVEQGISYCKKPGDDNCVTTTKTTALINPGEVHTGVPGGGVPMTYRMIHIPEALFNILCKDILDKDIEWEFTSTITADPAVRDAVTHFHTVTNETQDRFLLESALIECLATIIPRNMVKRQNQAQPAAASLENAKEILHTPPEENLSLQDLAEAVGLSKYHLLRSFKRRFGVTPQVYRTQVRLQHARELLKKGTGYTETALASGFTDQSHFIKTFYKYYGFTPGQYT